MTRVGELGVMDGAGAAYVRENLGSSPLLFGLIRDKPIRFRLQDVHVFTRGDV